MRGYCLIELLVVGWVVMVLGAIAVPGIRRSLDAHRTAGAARYLTTTCVRARMEAISRSRDVALRFVEDEGGFTFTPYVDGNGDGVRTRDIERGIDAPLDAPQRLSTHFAGVEFAVPPGLPGVDNGPSTDGDPVKLGAGDMLSFSAFGTSTPGSLYVRGPGGSQYVLKAFAETARIRTLRFDQRTRQWHPA
jgi:hypothetical protein